ncbi:MAG: 3-phosphoserine/phosphohydroxythreonine transaminase [Clostridia bacterium]|nr:3-phosphoserine/phosphohydroxythreonine transaminase [Clostridia bacterium]
MERVYNFSAGPSVIAESVLKKAQAELVNYGDAGMSVMEMSHRSPVYQAIIDETEALLREVLSIPDDYAVLFLQGGASSQFAMIPLNLANGSGAIDLVLTGQWASKANQEASKYCQVNIVGSSKDKTFSYIPKLDKSTFNPDADYFYICSNNTIYGTRFATLPECGNVPLVADMSSCILSEKIDVSKYGLIFAGAQKNMGPAGLTVVIIRKDLIGKARDITPTMFNYEIHANNGSMYNTPPTFAIYMCKLVLEWLKNEIGGIEAMEEINHKKAAIMYDYLDSSKVFKPTVSGADRSYMNIPFITGNEDLDKAFVKAATAAGFVNLKGHRSVGGMRASIYNAMPVEGVEKLVKFMKDYEVSL